MNLQYNFFTRKNITLRTAQNITKTYKRAETLMADSALRNRAKDFAKEAVFLCREIKLNHKEAVLANQLLRSATSIGANLHEAQYAQSTKDFISKFEIAQKECYETEYWLELLFETECITQNQYKHMRGECGAIRRMLISSLNTIKAHQI